VSKIFVCAIVLLVFFAALVRWVGFPVAWSIDVAQLLFGWVVFLGADMALKNNNHIGIDMIIEKFPEKARKTVTFMNYIIICIFLTTIMIYGFYLSYVNFERQFNSIQISYSYATLSVPFGCVLMLITAITKIYQLAKSDSK